MLLLPTHSSTLFHLKTSNCLSSTICLSSTLWKIPELSWRGMVKNNNNSNNLHFSWLRKLTRQFRGLLWFFCNQESNIWKNAKTCWCLFLHKYAGRESHQKGNVRISFTSFLSHLVNAKQAGIPRAPLKHPIPQVPFPSQPRCRLPQPDSPQWPHILSNPFGLALISGSCLRAR